MERSKESVVFLDTHVVVWLFENRLDTLSKKALRILEQYPLYISPMVKLELGFLKEVKKIKHNSEVILSELLSTIGLEIAQTHFHQVIQNASLLSWTRDPFDRIITAEAMVHGATLISCDKTIQKYYEKAVG